MPIVEAQALKPTYRLLYAKASWAGYLKGDCNLVQVIPQSIEIKYIIILLIIINSVIRLLAYLGNIKD